MYTVALEIRKKRKKKNKKKEKKKINKQLAIAADP